MLSLCGEGGVLQSFRGDVPGKKGSSPALSDDMPDSGLSSNLLVPTAWSEESPVGDTRPEIAPTVGAVLC